MYDSEPLPKVRRHTGVRQSLKTLAVGSGAGLVATVTFPSAAAAAPHSNQHDSADFVHQGCDWAAVHGVLSSKALATTYRAFLGGTSCDQWQARLFYDLNGTSYDTGWKVQNGLTGVSAYAASTPSLVIDSDHRVTNNSIVSSTYTLK